jgi:hypothetical protein
MCMPLRSIERILPLGRMLALPPPFRATVRPGGVRTAEGWVAVPGLAGVPGFPGVPDFAIVPGLLADALLAVAAPGFPGAALRPVVEGLAAAPVLADVAPGLAAPVLVAGAEWLVVRDGAAVWARAEGCDGAETWGAAGLGAGGALVVLC